MAYWSLNQLMHACVKVIMCVRLSGCGIDGVPPGGVYQIASGKTPLNPA
jgi:hypothetical protein